MNFLNIYILVYKLDNEAYVITVFDIYLLAY